MGTDHDDQLVRRRDELRRIVYGQPGEPSPEVASELAALEEELAARERVGGGAEGRTAPGSSGSGSASDAAAASARSTDRRSPEPHDGDDGDWWEEPAVSAPSGVQPPMDMPVPSPRRRRITWVIGGTIAVLVVIAVALAVLAPARDALSPPRGLGVFEREQTEEELDRVNQVATGVGMESEEDVATLRSLGRAFGYDFWAWRNDERVCLLSQRQYFFEWVETCASIEVFGTYGLTRLIAADDIRNGARPKRIGPGDVVVITWGPESTDVEWIVEP
jgi:hypothetical protein